MFSLVQVLVNTALRLANNVGIIDSGYRGNLVAMVDCVRGLGKGLDTSGMDNYSVERFMIVSGLCSYSWKSSGNYCR